MVLPRELSDDECEKWEKLSWEQQEEYYYDEREKFVQEHQQEKGRSLTENELDDLEDPRLNTLFWKMREISLLKDNFGGRAEHRGKDPVIRWVKKE